MPVLLSILLGLVPLVGVGWVLTHDSLWTVDGLFMSLILLTISGVLFLNAALELRDRRRRVVQPKTQAQAATGKGQAGLVSLDRARGVVLSVMFFEAPVGQPDKSVITMRNGAGTKLLSFEGDLRNTVPVGREVEITYRFKDRHNDLLKVEPVARLGALWSKQAA